MKLVTLFKAAVPVVIGVIAAGMLMNALKDNEWVQKAMAGFDN